MNIVVGVSVSVGKKICFTKTRKNLTFWRCIEVLDLVLKCCSDVNEGSWILFSFSSDCWSIKFASLIEMRFSVRWVRSLSEIFSYCTFSELFAIGIQNWIDHEKIDFWVFCLLVPRFFVVISARTKICKICSIVYLFRRHEIFTVISLRGHLVCFLVVPLSFNRRSF